MKKTVLFLTLVLAYFAGQSQKVIVGTDHSFKKSLNDYSTYAWSKNIDQIPSDQIYISPTGVYVFNNESVRSKIKNAIEFELSAKGYKKDESNPQMLVLFTVTERPGHLKTYNGYSLVTSENENMNSPENIRNTKIDAGTLIINIVDAKSGVVAWQGLASGILKTNMINDESKVRQAVASIFNRFKYKAKK